MSSQVEILEKACRDRYVRLMQEWLVQNPEPIPYFFPLPVIPLMPQPLPIPMPMMPMVRLPFDIRLPPFPPPRPPVSHRPKSSKPISLDDVLSALPKH